MSKGKREIVEVAFRPAKGGVVSETRTRSSRGGQGGGPDWDHSTETAVHPTAEHAGKHLKAMLSHCFSDEESKESE